MIVYKVVEILDGKMLSVSALWSNEYAVEYAVGETTYPKLGYLYAFTTYEDAAHFQDIDGSVANSRILECEAEVVMDTVKIAFSNYERFWSNPNNYGVPFANNVSYTDESAIYCKSVKVLRIIDEDYSNLPE